MAEDRLTRAAAERLGALGRETSQTIESAEFARLDAPIYPFTSRLVTTSLIRQTLARLFGWYDSGKQWRRLQIDADGNLKVTSAKAVKATCTFSQVDVGVSSTLVVAANSDRVRLRVKNVGGNNCYIGSDASVTITSGWLLEPGDEFTFDNYVGAVYGIAVGAPTRLSLYEV